MIKRILCLLFLFSSIGFAENKFEIKLGMDTQPQFNTSPEKNAKTSYELSLDYKKRNHKNYEIGVGLAYQNHGKLKTFIDVEDTNLKVEVHEAKLYDSLPIYITGGYQFRNQSQFTPYIKLNVGYSFNLKKDRAINYATINKHTGNVIDNGLLREINIGNGEYYSIGFGIRYKNIIGDIAYQVNEAKIKSKRYDGTETKGNIDFTRVTMSFGYQFGL